jgi:hypothetical protein
LEFKTEITLLVTAIVLFTIGTFCYSYVIGNLELAFALAYPYRAYAFPIVTFGSALMAVATFSYSKRSKSSL